MKGGEVLLCLPPFLLEKNIMIQLTNDSGYQSFYLKLDGYDTTALANVRVTMVNQLTSKLTSFGSVTPTEANGRYTTIQIDIPSTPKLVEGLYLVTVKNVGNNVTYATRLAFISSTPAFEESTYTPYEETDTNAYKVYVQ